MNVEHARGQAGFVAALGRLQQVAETLDDQDLLAASHCRGWTVGDVLVHVHLGLQEMLLGVVSPTGAEPDTDAASYWRATSACDDPDADAITATRFVRVLGSAHSRPTGVVTRLRPTAAALAGAVARLTPGRVRFQGHVLTTGDFLATWAVELAVHHLDLSRELELAPPATAALALTRETLEALAGGPAPAQLDDARLALLGTGRATPDPRGGRHPGSAGRPVPGALTRTLPAPHLVGPGA